MKIRHGLLLQTASLQSHAPGWHCGYPDINVNH